MSDPDVISDPDSAREVLGLVNDWVKHAETKAGAALAASGVVGGVLYNLTKGHHDLLLSSVIVLCAVCVFLTALAALGRFGLAFGGKSPQQALFTSITSPVLTLTPRPTKRCFGTSPRTPSSSSANWEHRYGQTHVLQTRSSHGLAGRWSAC